MRKTKLACFVALAVHQLSNPALAQTAPAETSLPAVKVQTDRELPPTYNPPTAVSATKIEAPLRDIPQTVNVVPQQVIRDQGALSLESVLRYVPGVGLSNGDGQRDQVTIRGFSAISDQFVDGIRDDALYFRDLSNIEQVEVIKGPASVLYGRGSSGGLINRITKKPGINKSEVSATVGSWDQRRGEFDLARDYSENGSGFAFRVTGAIERADSYRDQQFLDREVLSPSFLYKFNPNTSLLLQAERLSDRRVTDFGIPSFRGKPVDVPPSTYYGAANARDVDYAQSDVTSYGFTFDHKFNEKLSLRNTFRHYDYELDRNNTLVSKVNEAAQTAELNHFSFKREDDGYFNQTELTQKLEIAGVKHQLLYGMEIGRQDKGQALSKNPNIVGTVDLFEPVLPVVAKTFAGDPTTLSDMDTNSIYLQDLVTLSDQWKALAGVRYDKFEQKTRNTVNGTTLERTDREWSPRVGVVYQPTTRQSYYASYSKSFQPSAENFPLLATNEDIAPEETTNKEIGAKFDFFDGLASATASLFQLERTNIKSTDPANPKKLIPVGTQRTNGLELTFTGDLSNGWQVWSGYSYLDAKVTSSTSFDTSDNINKKIPIEGKRATLTPKHSANLWVTKAFGNGYRAGAGVNYVDERFANTGNTVTLPSYTTVDAMVGYKIAGLDLQLNINNLFDREYIVSGHGTAPNLNTPGAPRNVQLTARYNF